MPQPIATQEQLMLQISHVRRPHLKRDEATKIAEIASRGGTRGAESGPVKMLAGEQVAELAGTLGDSIAKAMPALRAEGAGTPSIDGGTKRETPASLIVSWSARAGTFAADVKDFIVVRATTHSGLKTSACRSVSERLRQLKDFARGPNVYPIVAIVVVLILLIVMISIVVLSAFHAEAPRQEFPPRSVDHFLHPPIQERPHMHGPSPRAAPGRTPSEMSFDRDAGEHACKVQEQPHLHGVSPRATPGRTQGEKSFDRDLPIVHKSTNTRRPSCSAVDLLPTAQSQLPSSSGCSGSSPGAKDHILCPRLVVPMGMELVCNVRDVLHGGRQQVCFSILDLDGQPISNVIVREVQGFPKCGIELQLLDTTTLAFVNTEMVHRRPGGLPEIRRPGDELFCNIIGAYEEGGTRKYVLRSCSGVDIFAFQGNFGEKAINAVDPFGRLACATRRCDVNFDRSPDVPYYEVRFAAHADAGLLLCGLLAIDKVESSTTSL
eukprot:CAMPEP_0117545278 /NCGR_PEP_ID=MMETSP0784-20121206/46012_1 /TAXON_ID=39447 /ORGANISM="" /LENGTH=491 /DNA_ID=CAMNT_0005342119 /DNA_START=155 /DNA_END=1630 /DNA_ORIENTATION=+